MVILLIIIIIAVILFSLYVYLESAGFRVVNYHLKSSKLPNHEIKIVFLSDLHNKDYGNKNEILVQKINELNPDFICFAGDMITSGWEFSYDYSHTLGFISKLASKYPVFYAPGNHEEYMNYDRKKFPTEYDSLISSLSEMGVYYLNNEASYLEEYGITIYGLNIPFDYFKHRRITTLSDGLIENLLGSVDHDTYSVMLAHNPVFFKDYAKWSPDLVLSGHVHGGIVALPLLGGVIAPGYRLFPKYDAGLFFEGKSTMLLSRGIGSHTIPIRINNKAEIVCLTLEGVHNES